MRTASPPSPARHLRHATQDGGTGLAKGLATVNAERQQAGQAPSSHRKIGSTCCAKGPGRFGRCKGPRPGWRPAGSANNLDLVLLAQNQPEAAAAQFQLEPEF